MPIDRNAVIRYAEDRWFLPCKDGKVWLANQAIDVAAEMAKRRLNPSEWTAAFLYYGPESNLEGLYLIPAAAAVQLPNKQKAADYPTKHWLASWYDDPGREDRSVPPPALYGLNDCAHFVTECLAAGGESGLRTPSVPTLLQRLTDHADTRTLARCVSQDRAQRIIDAGLFKPGDIFIFSKTVNRHGHSTIHLGDGRMAMHTYSYHPRTTIWTANAGRWTQSMTEEHNLVTLIHWNEGDSYTSQSDPVLGWWRVVWRGDVYYYHFKARGRVIWTKQKPTGPTTAPSNAGGRGYWFERPTGIAICWTSTGSLEQFLSPAIVLGSAMAGTWNDTEPIVATRL